MNICIPDNYIHYKEELNTKTNETSLKAHRKHYIERWYSLTDKFNEVLPLALNFDPPKTNSKWWSNFRQLEHLRNKITHVVESESNERYSALLENQVFKKIESYKDAIKFIGHHLTKQRHYLLNDFPYGFGFDDIRPYLIGDDIYNDFR